MNDLDTTPDRKGEWMQRSSGGKFWPLDPRIEDIAISDIANGTALDCRYAGQGRVDRFYSVAEHSFKLAQYAYQVFKRADVALATLLHDAPEAYLNDLIRAVKHAVGAPYEDMEARIAALIWEKYDVVHIMLDTHWSGVIKELDRRIVPLEKAAIMRYPQPWAYDQFEPLDGVQIDCWDPVVAKRAFLAMYAVLAQELGMEVENYEI